jgi:hypothetical protein
VVARDDDFADALAATPFAVTHRAPILLTGTAALDARSEAEIRRVLLPGGTVYVLGGNAALAVAVSSALGADGFAVVRLAGANRYATAVAIAATVDAPSAILVATGLNPADALAAGAAAAHTGAVVMLTADAVMPPETSAYVAAHRAPQFALGGPAAEADPAATPLVGADRYATSVAVAKQFFRSPPSVGLANGFAFPDALAGGAHIGLQGGPMLLVPPGALLPATVDAVLGSRGSDGGYVYGGNSVLSDQILIATSTALAGY